MGRTGPGGGRHNYTIKFQLTRPVWGEPRRHWSRTRRRTSFQLTRPVWGEPPTPGRMMRPTRISTHSPRVGRTILLSHIKSLHCRFQLTRPVWGEPTDHMLVAARYKISTHSPRVGRTPSKKGRSAAVHHFNSLAPCGANRMARRRPKRPSPFQLTRPVWGEPPGR